jgi:bacteriocin-like protein
MITEMNLLSDEELNAVSGGDKASLVQQAKQNALENAQAAAEAKKQADAAKGFNQLLNSIT